MIPLPRFRSLFFAVTAVLILAASSSQAATTSIGASFVGRGADPADLLAPADVAGVAPQANWNNLRDDGVFKGQAGALIDSAGNLTSIALIYDCSDSWNSDGGTTTADEKLMKGIIKCNPEPDGAPA